MHAPEIMSYFRIFEAMSDISYSEFQYLENFTFSFLGTSFKFQTFDITVNHLESTAAAAAVAAVDSACWHFNIRYHCFLLLFGWKSYFIYFFQIRYLLTVPNLCMYVITCTLKLL